MHRSLPAIVAVMLCTMAGDASSASVKVTTVMEDRGGVTARLLASFDVHATAARRWYANLLAGARPGDDQFTLFAGPLLSDHFVSFTYEYLSEGKTAQRVYHARSGKTNPWRNVRGPGRVDTYAAYFPRDIVDVVAWDRLNGHAGLDAEGKVARQVERDIRNGLVTRGGTLRGFASQAPCASCSKSLETLASKRGVAVDVTVLDPSGPVYRRFINLRRQYMASMRAALDGVNVTRPYPHPDGTTYTVNAPRCLAASTK
jgi:hypothetical protein